MKYHPDLSTFGNPGLQLTHTSPFFSIQFTKAQHSTATVAPCARQNGTPSHHRSTLHKSLHHHDDGGNCCPSSSPLAQRALVRFPPSSYDSATPGMFSPLFSASLPVDTQRPGGGRRLPEGLHTCAAASAFGNSGIWQQGGRCWDRRARKLNWADIIPACRGISSTQECNLLVTRLFQKRTRSRRCRAPVEASSPLPNRHSLPLAAQHPCTLPLPAAAAQNHSGRRHLHTSAAAAAAGQRVVTGYAAYVQQHCLLLLNCSCTGELICCQRCRTSLLLPL